MRGGRKDQVSLLIRSYWKIRDELVIAREVVFKGDRIIIPKSKLIF